MLEMPAMLWRAFCGLGGADEGEEGMKDAISLPNLDVAKKSDGTLAVCASYEDCAVTLTLDPDGIARLRDFLNGAWPEPEWWCGEKAAEEHKKRESERVESLRRPVQP
jgi:hypothetical protein